MKKRKVLVTGGAGYVGSALVPKLLEEDYQVVVLDLMLYGEHVFDSLKEHSNLTLVKGDIRDRALLEEHLPGCFAVIHLACISNDPSFELNPELGRSINLDAFTPLVDISKKVGVERFIYASSSSVYGIKEERNVTEDLSLAPLTDYSKYKAECEEILKEKGSPDFTVLTIRPATVCGYAVRQRLDVVVNIFVNHAFHHGKIKIFGGNQLRPNIHISDMVDLYLQCLKYPRKAIQGKIYNVGDENHTVRELALMAKEVVGDHVGLEVISSNDNRSYHISSQKIKDELGFFPKYGIKDAMQQLVKAFSKGKLPNALDDDRYYNIKMMQKIKLK